MKMFALDLRSIRLFRAALGAVIVAYGLQLLWEIPNFFSDSGIFPRWYYEPKLGLWAPVSPFYWSDSVFWNAFLLLLLMVLGILLAAGFAPRRVSAGIFLLLVAIFQRAPAIQYGVDDLLRALAFLSIWLPTGAVPGGGHERANFATAGALIQIALVYGASGFLKSSEAWFWNPQAVYLALRADRLVTPAGTWLTQFPDLLELATVATWLGERAAPLLLFVPWRRDLLRWGFIAAFGLLHIAIAVCFGLHLFSATALTMLLLLVPSTAWGETEGGEPEPPSRLLAGAGALCLGLFLMLGIWHNFHLGGRASQPQWLNNFVHKAGLRQSWHLFAPVPFRNDGWLRFEGTLDDGRRVDPLWMDEIPAGRVRPGKSRAYPNLRWLSVFQQIMPGYRAPDYRVARQLAQFLCARWEALEHSPLTRLDIFYSMEYSQPPGVPEEIVPMSVYSSGCFFQAAGR